MRLTKTQQNLLKFEENNILIETIEGTFNTYKVYKTNDKTMRKLGYKFKIYKVFFNGDIEHIENIKTKKEIELYYYY